MQRRDSLPLYSESTLPMAGALEIHYVYLGDKESFVLIICALIYNIPSMTAVDECAITTEPLSLYLGSMRESAGYRVSSLLNQRVTTTVCMCKRDRYERL